MHVVIIGAGIGGLTLAIALRRQGHTATIYEQSAELGEVGAGITLWPNACKVLFALGLKPQLDAIAVEPVQQKIFHFATSEVIKIFERGETMRAAYGAPLYQLHRRDLHAVLSGAVLGDAPDSIHLSHQAVEVAHRPGGGGRVRFSNGEWAEGDLIVGCDGIRSTVRELVFGHEAPLFTNVIAYRALVPEERITPELRADPTGIHIGPQSNVVHYMIRNRTMVNYLAFSVVDEWEEEGWRIPAPVDSVLERFAGYHPTVTGMIAATPPENLFKWGLFDRDVRDVWHDGPFALLGDAAHPMLPFLGQGAGMVIEDAMILARAVSEKGDLPEALAAYEAARKPRANYALRTSRKHGKYYNSHPDDAPDDGLDHDLDLNLYDAASVPI